MADDPTPSRTNRLTRADWLDAAIGAIERRGLGGVSVEALAGDLGVTKGSFYWHFESRADLIHAALEEWAVGRTRRHIESLTAVADPADRLRELVGTGAAMIHPMDTQLIAAMGHPEVAAALSRHHRLWLDFAADTYRRLGCPQSEAEVRAAIAYSVYLGLAVLHASGPLPAALPLDADARTLLLDTLIPPHLARGRHEPRAADAGSM